MTNDFKIDQPKSLFYFDCYYISKSLYGKRKLYKCYNDHLIVNSFCAMTCIFKFYLGVQSIIIINRQNQTLKEDWVWVVTCYLAYSGEMDGSGRLDFALNPNFISPMNIFLFHG